MFYRQQPDLNWRNPQVEHAMFARCASGWIAASPASVRRHHHAVRGCETARCAALGGDNARRPKLSDIYTNNLAEVHASFGACAP